MLLGESGPHHGPMLEMRPCCECCGTDLDPTRPDAYVCSFECTFCTPCTHDVLHERCPNCGGDLVPRPTRSAELLRRHPASTERIVREEGCLEAPSA